MFAVNNVAPANLIYFYAGTGGIAKGQLGMLSSGTVIDATEGQTTAVLVGVAAEDAAAGAIVPLYPLDSEIECDVYQGGATDDATDAMVGVAYDLEVVSTDHQLDFNDTTNPMFVLMRYDNTRHKAWVRVINALRYI